MKRVIFITWLLAAGFSAASAEVVGKPLDYKDGKTTMKGYVAYDDSVKGKRPGVLVVHEWWGHNEYARKRARMLAELGYTALAVDMYGDGKQAAHPDEAGAFSQAVMKDLPQAEARFNAALAELKKQPTVEPAKLAAIGYCFGGGVSLHMARVGADLKGVASFHGSLGEPTKAKRGAVKARVLVCHGGDDTFVPAQAIDAFKQEMEAAGVDYEFLVYEGAVHSFTNPEADDYGRKFNLPLAYNPDADEDSWADLQDFLEEIFE